MVNAKGIHVATAKIEAIKKWEAPRTLTEIHQFLGLAGYYHRFIETFSKIAKPLTTLTQKTKEFLLEEEQEEAIQTLKNKLCDAPILYLPEGTENFVITQETREELHDVRLGTWSCSIRPKNLETLPLRNKVHRVHRPSESQTYPQPEDAQHETEKIVKALRMLVQMSLISRILDAQREAMKEENLEEEALSCANQKLKTGADGINYLNGRA
ncbi:hypothetical protein Tco_0789687 [Tanacetum coccineum]